MKGKNWFQFQKVRLKVRMRGSPERLGVFQFQKVRLKAAFYETIPFPCLFQFQKVRLKVSRRKHNVRRNRSDVSIPKGTIKSPRNLFT